MDAHDDVELSDLENDAFIPGTAIGGLKGKSSHKILRLIPPRIKFFLENLSRIKVRLWIFILLNIDLTCHVASSWSSSWLLSSFYLYLYHIGTVDLYQYRYHSSLLPCQKNWWRIYQTQLFQNIFSHTVRLTHYLSSAKLNRGYSTFGFSRQRGHILSQWHGSSHFEHTPDVKFHLHQGCSWCPDPRQFERFEWPWGWQCLPDINLSSHGTSKILTWSEAKQENIADEKCS